MASDGTLKFDTSLDTGGLQSGMGKVASVAQQALGVFTGQMMTRAVDALANLGKSALDSVGQLEQNVGGVETLFGDAADAVIASADRAYQTAGMSANDYMSTVTSFSASLLQSLGGNTEEAGQSGRHGHHRHGRQREQDGDVHGHDPERLPGLRETKLHDAGQPEARLRRHQDRDGAPPG